MFKIVFKAVAPSLIFYVLFALQNKSMNVLNWDTNSQHVCGLFAALVFIIIVASALLEDHLE